MKRFMPLVLLFSLGAVAATWYAACNQTTLFISTGQFPPGSGNIIIGISDPPACAAPTGMYSHIYVTISRVEASPNPLASADDASLVDLAPQLVARPIQVDLLGEADNDCQVATLGRGTVRAGVYRMIRVSLLDASGGLPSIPGGNRCGQAAVPTANCVVTSGGAVLPLSIPPGSWFDIGPGDMLGGQFEIASSATTQLNLSLDGCDSLVSVVSSETPGSYAFVPTARAAVTGRASAITGRVTDAATGKPIVGRAIVAIEQRDDSGVDRIVMATAPGADGSFLLCPVPEGNYDLAVTAVSGAGTAYGPILLIDVPSGTETGNITLTRAGTISASPATVVGQVSLLAGTARGFGHVRVSALAGGSAMTFTVPLPRSSAGTLVVAGPSAIPYSFTVPAASPRVGVFSEHGTNFTQDTSQPPGFTVEARGCGSTKTTASPVRVTAGGTASAPILTISTCGPA
jgi:hypothetical protein